MRRHHKGLPIDWWCRMDPARREPLTSAPQKKKKNVFNTETLTSKKSNKQVKVVTFTNARQLNSKSRFEVHVKCQSSASTPEMKVARWIHLTVSLCGLEYQKNNVDLWTECMEALSNKNAVKVKHSISIKRAMKKEAKTVLPSLTSPHSNLLVWNLILSQFTIIYSISFPYVFFH